MEKKDLKPAIVFRYFEEVCQVPRPRRKKRYELICSISLRSIIWLVKQMRPEMC